MEQKGWGGEIAAKALSGSNLRKTIEVGGTERKMGDEGFEPPTLSV